MQRRRKAMAEINVVPFIDVMLVLLVIFMITAPLLTQGVQVDLPQAQAKALKEDSKTPLIISIDDHGLFYLNVSDTPDQPMAPQALATRVAAELALSQRSGHPRQVMVKGDSHVNYSKVMEAMVLLQHAGAPSVGLITRPGDDNQT